MKQREIGEGMTMNEHVDFCLPIKDTHKTNKTFKQIPGRNKNPGQNKNKT